MTNFLCGVCSLISSRFCFCSSCWVRWTAHHRPRYLLSKKRFVHRPYASEWVCGRPRRAASLMHISEEVCWLQQEDCLSTNNVMTDPQLTPAYEKQQWISVFDTFVFNVFSAPVASLATRHLRQSKNKCLRTPSFRLLLPQNTKTT